MASRATYKGHLYLLLCLCPGAGLTWENKANAICSYKRASAPRPFMWFVLSLNDRCNSARWTPMEMEFKNLGATTEKALSPVVSHLISDGRGFGKRYLRCLWKGLEKGSQIWRDCQVHMGETVRTFVWQERRGNICKCLKKFVILTCPRWAAIYKLVLGNVFPRLYSQTWYNHKPELILFLNWFPLQPAQVRSWWTQPKQGLYLAKKSAREFLAIKNWPEKDPFPTVNDVSASQIHQSRTDGLPSLPRLMSNGG